VGVGPVDVDDDDEVGEVSVALADGIKVLDVDEEVWDEVEELVEEDVEDVDEGKVELEELIELEELDVDGDGGDEVDELELVGGNVTRGDVVELVDKVDKIDVLLLTTGERVYRSNIPPEPQYSRGLLLHSMLQDEVDCSVEPTASLLPQ
jgi:hypothetical protein